VLPSIAITATKHNQETWAKSIHGQQKFKGKPEKRLASKQ
jgi:hypothetical protein